MAINKKLLQLYVCLIVFIWAVIWYLVFRKWLTRILILPKKLEESIGLYPFLAFEPSKSVFSRVKMTFYEKIAVWGTYNDFWNKESRPPLKLKIITVLLNFEKCSWVWYTFLKAIFIPKKEKIILKIFGWEKHPPLDHHIFWNKHPREKLKKVDPHYFSILEGVYFLHFFRKIP